MIRNWTCLLAGHKYVFLHRTKDWLEGGTYFWKCSRCGKNKTSQPYMGGMI